MVASLRSQILRIATICFANLAMTGKNADSATRTKIAESRARVAESTQKSQNLHNFAESNRRI
ncbi:hypothetical protein ACWIUD_07320 [Helicobacter sp. 23-1044]